MRPIVLIEFFQRSRQQVYTTVDIFFMGHLNNLVQVAGGNGDSSGNSPVLAVLLNRSGICTSGS